MTAALKGKRILVVEDEFLIAMMLEDMLEELGCVVAGVIGRPSDAFELIDSTPIDAAVLDVNLNGEDSFPIAATLRERGIPFIFATGYGDGARVTTEFAGYTVVEKPYQLRNLSNALLSIASDASPAPARP